MEEKNQEHFHVFSKDIEDEEVEHYDVCILGGGPAGLTSAIYAARYGLHTALISKDVGGMANLASIIENYPGYKGSGMKLMQSFYNQAKNAGTEFLNSEAIDIHKDKTGFIIELHDKKVVHSKTLVIALGTEKRKLNIENEDKYIGKGISYCVACDAPLFKQKDVAVIGGRNSAAKAALTLSSIAEKVYIIYRQGKLNCDKIDEEKIQKKANIELKLNSVPKKVIGKDFVTGLDIKNETLDVEGIFIEIGSMPVKDITTKLGINTDESGYIKVNAEMATNVKGIFAAGDTIKSKLKQIVISAGQGAIASHSVKEYLER